MRSMTTPLLLWLLVVATVIADDVERTLCSNCEECGGAAHIAIPESVTSIGQFAFSNCSYLSSVVIRGQVTSIGSLAFSGCSSLSSVVIPDQVTSIDRHAFPSCYGFGLTVNGANTRGTVYCLPCADGDPMVIPSNVTSISYYAFAYCSSLRSVVIPDQVTSIGSSVFRGCSSLSSVVIPDQVTYIGDWAFSGCSSLSSVVIPDQVAGLNLFDAFPSCYGFGLTVNGANTSGTVYCLPCAGGDPMMIPPNVTSIGNDAFLGCSSLRSVVIPKQVTSIGCDAFYGCSNLTSVVMSDLTSFDSSAFPSGFEPVVYTSANTKTLCSTEVVICNPGFAPPTCSETVISSEGEAEQSIYFYVAAGTVVFLEVLYLWRTGEKLFFACTVIFRSFDFMSDWANYAIALQSANFVEGMRVVEMDYETVSIAALIFNIVGTLLWIPDMWALSKRGKSSLTKYVVFFEDIPQLVFAGIYLAAVLSTSVYGGDDGCQLIGTLPLDPVVIVSLAFSSLGLLFNAYLAFFGGDEKVVLAG